MDFLVNASNSKKVIYFKRKENSEREYNLYINDECLWNVDVWGYGKRKDKIYYEISTGNPDATEKLLKHKLAEFPCLEHFSFHKKHDLTTFLDNQIWISPKYPKDSNGDPEFIEFSSNSEIQFEIGTSIKPNLLKWKYLYTFEEYVENFEIVSKKFVQLETRTYWGEEVERFGVGLSCLANFNDEPLIIEVEKFLGTLKQIHLEVLERLENNSKHSSIISAFNFPDEVKIPCEQYLLYFTQFLRDLGVNATSHLKHEAGNVLFSITPNDDNEALDKICEALAVYLNLPSSPIVYDESFKAMRLQQQIENLQHSQKMAARELQLTEKLIIAQSEMIQEKNIIISQKDSIIEQQNKVIEKITSKSIMMDSLENKEELEEICEGLKIGESKFLKEQLGIHFNPAKVIKTGVNNLFGKGDEIISILDSDEETEKNS
jgi:hypothetical protein